MSEAKEDFVCSTECSQVGPDYFAYYACSVKTLLSQLNQSMSLEVRGKEVDHSLSSLFVNSLGAGLSDSEREKLKLYLREGVKYLSPEVEQMLEPVLGIKRLKSQLKSKKCRSPTRGASPDQDASIPYKKRKRSASVSSTSLSDPFMPTNPESSREVHAHLQTGKESEFVSNMGAEKENGKVDDDLQQLMENDRLQIKKTVKKYSNEFAATLGHMKQKLEELLDTVISTCRPMTIPEKHKLGKLLESLPAENLDRAVEIIKHGNGAHTDSSDEIHVNLDELSNVTLWRLYYCVEAVESARKLAK